MFKVQGSKFNSPFRPFAPSSFLPSVFCFLLVGIIKLYQYTLSPFLGRQCRFVPTCSQYGIEAIKKHGALKGSWLAFKRILRCNPWGGSGYDPVP